VRAKVKIAFINADYEGVGHNKDFDRVYYAEYNHIVAVSDKLEQMVQAVFPEYANRITTVYDINNAEMIGKMAIESNPYEKETVHPVIVTVGRLVQQKGYDLAVEAARNMKMLGINFRWYFVGEGPSRNRIEQAIRQYDLSEHVILVGAKDNPYVYMKHADLYVQTSRFEGYCLTLAEARMLNKPVISTNFDVVYNQLRDEENGLIVSMDPEEIAGAIVRLWKNADLRNHIVENLKQEKKGNPEEIEKFYRMIEG
jgi:glycosyltransferase involved in cell wall biosynthesis